MTRFGRSTRAALAFALLGGVLATSASTTPTAAAAPPTDLFFSEYVEGSSLNKALEIYNGTDSAVDLAAGGYNIFISFNGGSSTSTFDLDGAIAAGDVFVFADDGADAAILAETDQTTTSSLFNGDDAILLRSGTTVVDAIGQLGFDPGSQWGSDEQSTQNNTIRRMGSVCAGDTDETDPFDPAVEWAGFEEDDIDGLGAHTADCDGGEPIDPVINEFVANHTGTDTSEYVEVYGAPSTDLGALTVLQIEGDGGGTATGTIDSVIPVGTTDTAGFWVSAFLNNEFENGTMTLLLVSDFAGSDGDDLDTDDDGVLDATPWTAIVDAVAVTDGGSDDLTYGEPALGSGFDGGGFTPGGASRIPDGVDTDTPADWVRNDFDGEGLPGFSGSPTVGEAINTPGTTNVAVEPTPGGDCGDPVVLIHQIQGSGATFDPAFGGTQSVEAVITALAPDFNGLYVQEEGADQDADPATSEGIFVFLGSDPTGVAVGDEVRVTGTVGEFVTSGGASSQTQLTSGPIVTVCGSGGTVPQTDVSFPLGDPSDMEAFEGMRVTFPQALAISEYFNFDRFNEVVVALPLPGDDRPFNPTAVAAPGADANARAAENARRRITIDDWRSIQNPEMTIHPGNGDPFTLTNTFRGGDTITGIEGVIDDTFGIYRIQPTMYGTYTAMNRRPEAPNDVGGDTRVASMNVLNYFLSLDDGPDDCGPGQDQGCRGADNADELARQRVKILAALAGLDADVIGVIEMENTTGVEPIDDLVNGMDGLNDMFGAGTYDFIDTGTIGTDAIRVGIIYRPGALTPVGAPAILDGTIDDRFDDTKNRPVLAQAFETASGRRFTVAVNHLKSKGSACDDVGDPDVLDGQGNCNITRTMAAAALADWLASDPTGSGTTDALIIGDLNAYDKEDPISTLLANGYTDLIAAYEGENAYSYVFSGEFGYLDHALASSGLVGAVTGATEWHINADEPDLLDYDTSFKSDGQVALFEPNAFRSSDHDPVVVGLELNPIPPRPTCHGHPATIVGTHGPDVIDGTRHRDVIVTFGGDDIVNSGNGADLICSGPGDDTVDAGNGFDTVFAGAGDDVVSGGNGPDLLFGEAGMDTLDGGRGPDLLHGGGDDDDLSGGSGPDLLFGGAGVDHVDGGRSFDVCVGENRVACEIG